MDDSDQRLDKIELTAIADKEKYLVNSKNEIARILNMLGRKPCIVTAYYGDADDFILTAVLDINEKNNNLVLDTGSNEERNQQLLGSDHVVCISSYDNIKVQFVCTEIEFTQYQDTTAFKCPLPNSLLHLQRREYYRLTTPIDNQAHCFFKQENGKQWKFNIVDISSGGIGIIDYDEELELTPYAVLTGCTIELPEIDMIYIDLEIRNIYDITMKNGTHARRAGFAFKDLPAANNVLIQRYIHSLDKQQREYATDEGV